MQLTERSVPLRGSCLIQHLQIIQLLAILSTLYYYICLFYAHQWEITEKVICLNVHFGEHQIENPNSFPEKSLTGISGKEIQTEASSSKSKEKEESHKLLSNQQTNPGPNCRYLPLGRPSHLYPFLSFHLDLSMPIQKRVVPERIGRLRRP